MVDDNQDFLDRMIILLEEQITGRILLTAHNFDEAAFLLEQKTPALIILDIGLPGKNGLELLKLINSQPHRPVSIILTNHTEHFYREQSMALGADHFLDKSEDFALVPKLVNSLLNN